MKPLKGFHTHIFWAVFLLFAFWMQMIYATSLNVPLTLFETEQLAVARSPELQRLQVNTDALNQQAIANDQLPNPQLMVGAINVPTNSFSFTQDDMTMLEVGLQQSFPAGHTLAIKSKQTQALAAAEQRKIREQTAILLQNVRQTWLDLYFWNHALKLIRENQILYHHLLNVTESQYSERKGSQSDVLQVQLDASRLNDQAIQAQQQITTLRAQLGRWIGQNQAMRLLPPTLPHWPNPPPLALLKIKLQQHPLLGVDAANIRAAQEGVALVKQQYKPSFMVGAGYGFREGQMIDGAHRSDMVSAQVTVDLPVFTRNRQDRLLNASADQLEAAELDQQIHYRDLLKELTAQYAIWGELSKRENIYKQQLVPESKLNSKSALFAYQSATTNLSSVLRAYSSELMIKQEQLQVQIESIKARAVLFYLEGDTE